MKNSKVFSAILDNKEEKIDVSKFSQLYVINFSEVGSNKKSEEDKTIYSFGVFLQDLEEVAVVDLKLEDLLIFITGAGPPIWISSPDDYWILWFQPWREKIAMVFHMWPAALSPSWNSGTRDLIHFWASLFRSAMVLAEFKKLTEQLKINKLLHSTSAVIIVSDNWNLA